MDMYRAVPLKLFLSLYGMCCLLECKIIISVIFVDVFCRIHLRFGISVLLGHTEVDDVDHVLALGTWSPNQEVVGLDVSVDQVLLVDCLDSR